MTDEERVQKGNQAANELRMTGEAFDKVRDAILAELVQTSPGQPEKVLALHRAVQNLTAVKTALIGVVNDGLMARDAIAKAGLTRNS